MHRWLALPAGVPPACMLAARCAALHSPACAFALCLPASGIIRGRQLACVHVAAVVPALHPCRREKQHQHVYTPMYMHRLLFTCLLRTRQGKYHEPVCLWSQPLRVPWQQSAFCACCCYAIIMTHQRVMHTPDGAAPEGRPLACAGCRWGGERLYRGAQPATLLGGRTGMLQTCHGAS